MIARRGLFRSLVLGCTLVTLAGCGSKGAVSVNARLSAVSLEIVQGPLVAELRGEFELALELGGSAPESTQIQAQTFSIARGETVLLDGLDVTASTAFPVELAPGERVVVQFEVAEGESVDATTASALCAASVSVRGAITDSASDRPTPVESTPLEVRCP